MKMSAVNSINLSTRKLQLGRRRVGEIKRGAGVRATGDGMYEKKRHTGVK